MKSKGFDVVREESETRYSSHTMHVTCDHRTVALQMKPMHSHTHSSEGYALAWSLQEVGALASGDCRGKLHTWAPREGGSWVVSSSFAGHTASVEDVEWSPTEGTVLASACVDKVSYLCTIAPL
jgi:WD40 repeat protein